MQISTKELSNFYPSTQIREKASYNADETVSAHQFLATQRGGKRGRFTFSMYQFNHHYKSFVQVAKNPWAYLYADILPTLRVECVMKLST